MANINVNFQQLKPALRTPAPQTRQDEQYTFVDLHLSDDFAQINDNEVFKPSQLTDLKADYDLGAIRNSIINMFLTSPGEKILNPEFGIDLRDYLFEPVSEGIAVIIQNQVLNNITIFEPRIIVNQVSVTPNFDNNEYVINIDVAVPFIGVDAYIIKTYLNANGYYFV